MTIGDLERWVKSRESVCLTIRRNSRKSEIVVDISCDHHFFVETSSKQGLVQALTNALVELQEQQNDFDASPTTQKIKKA